MKEFDWEGLRKSVNEWNSLYDSLMKLLDEKGSDIESPLFTMIKTGPYEYGKFQITHIRKEKNIWLDEPYIGLVCVNTEDELCVPVYRAFELKTDGAIRDIIMILQFIKTELTKKKVINLEPTIV